MTRFKIGDRVRFAHPPGGKALDHGTVVATCPSDDEVRVREDRSQQEVTVKREDIVDMVRPNTDRRWRWYVVSLPDFGHILRHTGCWFRLEVDLGDTLPADARIVGDPQPDWHVRGLRVRFEHESFDKVPDGCESPYGGALMLRVKREGE